MANVGVRTRWLQQTPAHTLETHGCQHYNEPVTHLQVSKVGQVCADSCGFIARVPQRCTSNKPASSAQVCHNGVFQNDGTLPQAEWLEA